MSRCGGRCEEGGRCGVGDRCGEGVDVEVGVG